MTYTNIRLFTANGIPEALSNLWYGTDCSVVEIQDAIEDAKNAADLLRRIQKMKLLRKVALDRETEQKVRFKTTDCWGNICEAGILRGQTSGSEIGKDGQGGNRGRRAIPDRSV